MHAFDGEAEGELYLSVGDIVVVRQVRFLISMYLKKDSKNIWMISNCLVSRNMCAVTLFVPL